MEPEVTVEPEPVEETSEMRAGRARLTIVSLPWSSVRIGGRPAVNTPIENVRVPSGTVTLRYQVRGEGPVRTRRVRLPPGASETIRLSTR